MKHENNFLLYSIASAFLLVATAVHLSVSDGSELLAQIGSVEVSIQETSEEKLYPITKITYSEIAGSVEAPENVVMSDVRITLFDTANHPEHSVVTMVIPDMLGKFVFTRVPPGEYIATITTVGDVEVLKPRASLSQFTNTSHGYQVYVDGNRNPAPLTFILDTKTSQ